MSYNIKAYNINDFIRKTASGKIDLNKSIEIVHELANAANFYPDHNILVDMRDTTIENASMSTMLQITFEMVNYRSVFKNKIANLIPDEPERIKIAHKFCECLIFSGFDYEFFVDYEAAIEWLSNISVLGKA